MNKRQSISVIVFLLVYLSLDVYADTIYLKSGGTFKGIIKKETDSSIELEMSFGTMSFSKNQITKIEKSTPQESEELKDEWEKERTQLKKKEKESSEERDRRFAEYDKWVRQSQAKKKKEPSEPQEVELIRDIPSKSYMVEVLLNENVKALLILDTGASLVVLSKKIGEQLGVDLTDTKNDSVELRLAGDRRVTAKAVTLKSLRIQGVVEENVVAAVLLEDFSGIGFKDGLLGSSFLNRFNMSINQKTMKMTLEKI